MKGTSIIWKWLILAILAALSIYVVVTPPGEQQAAEGKKFPGIRLGIDLAGGTSFTVQIDQPALRTMLKNEKPNATDAEIEEAMRATMRNADDRILEVLRKRVDGMGVNEPIIYKSKDHRVIIQLPGADEEQRKLAEQSIESAAFLEFRLVHRDNDNLVSQLLASQPAPEGFVKSEDGRGYIATAEYDTLKRDPDYRARLQKFGTSTMNNYAMMLREETSRTTKQKLYIPTIVSNRPEMSGDGLNSASAVQDPQSGQMQVQLSFNREGREAFALVTSKYCRNGSSNNSQIGRQLAIILDGTLYSAPELREPIRDGNAVISGNFTGAEASMLRNILNAGSLPTPVKIIEKRVLDPTLGRDAIQSGILAAIGGAIAVALFMLIYYFYCGLVANIALALDILLLPAGMIIAAGALSFFVRDAGINTRTLALPVFTMPGIAGIVLTIGMAVDANVLIFERIREEFRLGKSARAAVSAGYDRAFLAIFDSNITTLLTAVILFIFGAGPIRGFAITLTAGIIISMFTALVVTRMIFNMTVPEGRTKPYKMLSMVKENINIDFIGKGKPAMIGAGAIIAVTMLLFIFKAASDPIKVLAVDFTGGTTMDFICDKTVPSADIVNAVANKGIKVDVQSFADSKTVVLRTGLVSEDGSDDTSLAQTVQEALTEAFPESNFQYVSSDLIGSAVGADMRKAAYWSLSLALLVMLVYIAFRFEFGFALGAIVALAHDVFITIGLYALFGRQFSLTTVAALLTIVGYSINDTIVIFDRVREDLAKDLRSDFRTLVNQALNRTLSRTFLTSFSTLLPVLGLLLFGGGAIFDFALTMVIGIIAGTFSTLFIATPVMLAWYRNRRPGLNAAKERI